MDEKTKNKKANIEGLKKETCHCIESAYKKGYDIAIAKCRILQSDYENIGDS